MPKDMPHIVEAPPLEYGKRSFTWRDHIPSAAYLGQRWFPSVSSIGAELLGVADLDAQGKKTGRLTLPSLTKRVATYQEMLDVVEESKNWKELFALAGLRRQVTNKGGLPVIDRRFWKLARWAQPQLAPKEWLLIAERMPQRSMIYRACLHMSRK